MKKFKNITYVILGVLALLVIWTVWTSTLHAPVPEENENIIINLEEEEKEPLMGGDSDEHGCIGSAGYRWCEIKAKCLRIWEEPCETDENAELVKNYISANISELSPEKEVLGGKFYLNSFIFSEPGKAIIEYEDGHILFKAEVNYEIKDGVVEIIDFNIQ